MGLGGCYSVIKFLLVVFNFLFWVLGLLAVALAIWMLVDPSFYVSMVQDSSDYLISTYFLLIAGILLVIVAFLGCCGSFKEFVGIFSKEKRLIYKPPTCIPNYPQNGKTSPLGTTG